MRTSPRRRTIRWFWCGGGERGVVGGRIFHTQRFVRSRPLRFAKGRITSLAGMTNSNRSRVASDSEWHL